MARKQTPTKSAAKKVAPGKAAVRKPPARVSASAKESARKVQPAKKDLRQDHRQAIKAAAAKAAPLAKKEATINKPAVAVKPVAKGQAKPGAPVQQRPAGAKAAPNAGTAKPAMKPAAGSKPSFVPGARPGAAAGQRPMPAMNKQPGQTVTAPAGQNAQKAPAKGPQAPAPQPAAPKKPVHQRHGFKTSEWIVYPAHGVGRIIGIEEQEIAGVSLELFVITFEKDKMTLRVPTGKSTSVGMRKLAEENIIRRAMDTLKGKARVKRTMWSRRAQEYEAKINSGDLIAIAEVVRDLYRSESQPEQSYSERQLYEAALDRMAREVAVVDKLDERGAIQRITEVLAKSAKGRRMAAEEAAEVKAA